MPLESKACQECTRNCLLVHQRHQNALPIITRFFKIMVGEDYLKVLFLPPKFVRNVPNIIGQPSHLEDSNGQRWPIKVSIVDRYVAIQEGWCKFAQDHRLELGDFLVLSYIGGCRFLVQIYGRSGCEKSNFKRRRGRPRKRPWEEENVVPYKPLQHCQSHLKVSSTSNSDSDVPKRRPKHLRKDEIVVPDEPFQHGRSHRKAPTTSNANNDTRKRQSKYPREKEIVVPDEPFQRGQSHRKAPTTSNANKPNSDSGKRKSKRPWNEEIVDLDEQFQHGQSHQKAPTTLNSNGDIGQRKSQPTAVSLDDPVLMFNTNPGCTQGEDRTYLHDLSNFEMVKNECNLDKAMQSSRGEEMRNQIVSTDNDNQMAQNEEDHITVAMESAENINMSKGRPDVRSIYSNAERNNAFQGRQIVEVKNEPVVMGEVAFGLHQASTGPTVSVKRELVEMAEVAFCRREISIGRQPKVGVGCASLPSRPVKDIISIVKTEPGMPSASFPLDVVVDSIFVAVKCQSYLEFSGSLPQIFEGRKNGRGSHVIFLEDSVGRLWPVLCVKISGVTTFVDGWKSFCQMNDIQPGVVCEFQRESKDQLTYKVNVI